MLFNEDANALLKSVGKRRKKKKKTEKKKVLDKSSEWRLIVLQRGKNRSGRSDFWEKCFCSVS